MIESSQEIEIRKYLNLAEQHEKNGDSHATKEALLEAQVSRNKKTSVKKIDLILIRAVTKNLRNWPKNIKIRN